MKDNKGRLLLTSASVLFLRLNFLFVPLRIAVSPNRQIQEHDQLTSYSKTNTASDCQKKQDKLGNNQDILRYLSTIKDFIINTWNNSKVETLFIEKEIGNTIQNNYRIVYENDQVEIQETIAPDLVIEKFFAENELFASALAISLMTYLGDIQLCYVDKHSNSQRIEIAVYYSKNKAIDENLKKQIIFYHNQHNLNFEYIDTEKLVENSNLYSKMHKRAKTAL